MEHDLAIIGGGPAGMSAALVAGRARLKTLVVNKEEPRNRVTTASHGFLTRDGIHPLALLHAAKDDVRRYATVEYARDAVVAIAHEPDGFRLELASGRACHARRVVLATGHRDDLRALDLPGIEDVYGTSVFPCPFCDAYEHRDERLAIFGAAGVENYAPIVRMWSEDIAVFTNGRPLAAGAREALARNGVPVHEEKVRRLDAKDGRLTAVRLESGPIEREAGFLWDRPGVPATTLADDLRVPRKVDRGFVLYEADEMGRTHVPGLYIVGDLRTGFSKLMPAAAEGARCAEGIVHEVAHERWT